MSNTARPADRKISPPAAMFKKVLQAFANGDLPYSDVRSDLERLLTAGAPPEELCDVLQRYESIEPLPVYAREEVRRILNEAIERAAALNVAPDGAPGQPQDTASAASVPAPAPAPVRATGRAGEPSASPAESVSSIEEQIARQRADYQALTHAYERVRDAGSAASARTIALTAELAAVRSALESEQAKVRTLDQALAESIASGETARALLGARDAAIEQLRLSLGEREERLATQQREHATRVAALAAKPAIDEAARGRSEEARRESERAQVELGKLREALAARDAAIAQGRSALGEREVQLTALQREHTQIEAALESRNRSCAQLEADLQTSGARVDALTADLASAHTALASEQNKTRDAHKVLAEKVAADEAVRARGDEALRKAESYRAELSKLRDSIATRQQEHTRLVAAMEARTETLEARAETLEAQLQAARVRVEEKGEWKGSHEITVAIEPPRERTAVPAAPDWQDTHPPHDFEPAVTLGRFDARQAAPLFGSRGRWTAGKVARFIGVSAALVMLAVVAWIVVHRAPVLQNVPASQNAPAAAAVPKPGDAFRDCPSCPGMTVVPAGRFKQGSDRADGKSASFEKPPHWVMIGRPFAISTNAVTVDEFRAFIAASGRDMRGCDTYDDKWRFRPDSSWENPGFVQTGAHPVTCVSWDDAKAYAGWLSKATGHRYRLPSAAEWEYAARAGGEAVRPWNANGSSACASANVADQRAARRYPGWAAFACDDGYVYTAPVGSFKANSFGLNDMLGNVFQWTDDCWHADYTGVPVDGSARTYGDCSERELRGGSWFTAPDFVRASYRNHFGTNYRASSVGIRLVRDIGA